MLRLFLYFVYLIILTHGQYPPAFNELVSLIPGLYDNSDQVKGEEVQGRPTHQRHDHVVISLKEESVPFLSSRRNFYYQEWLNGTISRQNLFSFGIDPVMLAMQMKAYEFRDPSNFLNAATNDSVFLNLKEKDVVYENGCDVYWYQWNDTTPLFGSWMFHTCNSTFQGKEMTRLTFNNLTSSCLTASTFWFLPNGTEVHTKKLSPYHLTKQPDVIAIDQQRLSDSSNYPLPLALREPHDEQASTNQHAAGTDRNYQLGHPQPEIDGSLTTLDEVVQALVAGYPVRYHATLSQCVKGENIGVVDQPTELVGLIDTFEFFNDTQRFGMEIHLATSFKSAIVNPKGVHTLLNELRMYSEGRVSFTLSYLAGNLTYLLGQESYNCTTASGGRSGKGPSVTFVKDDVTVTQLMTSADLRSALTGGKSVWSVSYYGVCSIQADAIGGGIVDMVTLFQDRLVHSASKTITNYQGPFFVEDSVSTIYFNNGSVVAFATDRQVGTYHKYYSETIDCGRIQDYSGVFVFQLG